MEAEDGVILRKNVTAQAQLLKLPHEINLHLKDLHTVARCVCARCLAFFDCEINIPSAEREFLIDLPERDLEEGEDVHYVNKMTNEIELAPVIREEILLHFPGVTVCSESCKGLCDKCGVNMNKTACACVRETVLNLKSIWPNIRYRKRKCPKPAPQSDMRRLPRKKESL